MYGNDKYFRLSWICKLMYVFRKPTVVPFHRRICVVAVIRLFSYILVSIKPRRKCEMLVGVYILKIFIWFKFRKSIKEILFKFHQHEIWYAGLLSCCIYIYIYKYIHWGRVTSHGYGYPRFHAALLQQSSGHMYLDLQSQRQDLNNLT